MKTLSLRIGDAPCMTASAARSVQRITMVLALGCLLAAGSQGCGSDACKEAQEKLETCGFDVGEPGDAASCTGQSECEAECVLDACGCEDLDETVAESSDACRSCLLDCPAEG